MAADTTLLRDVIRWARANGWTRPTPGVTEWTHQRQWDAPNVCVERHANGEYEMLVHTYSPYRCIDVPNTTVDEAVGILVALGVLPARFSSAYAAGRASVLEGAVEQWAVVYGDHSHYRVSGSTQALQLAATARSQGGGEAYAAHRLLPEWQRMEADRG
jgi:hypothetical protein